MLPMAWAWLHDATVGMEFGAALLTLVGAGLAIAQRVRALRKGRRPSDDDEPDPDGDP